MRQLLLEKLDPPQGPMLPVLNRIALNKYRIQRQNSPQKRKRSRQTGTAQERALALLGILPVVVIGDCYHNRLCVARI
jgi:hypothetical protein